MQSYSKIEGSENSREKKKMAEIEYYERTKMKDGNEFFLKRCL